jgi:hypothetical protein
MIGIIQHEAKIEQVRRKEDKIPGEINRRTYSEDSYLGSSLIKDKLKKNNSTTTNFKNIF